MTVGIVIPLKSKQVSRDWWLTVSSLQTTLSSILNQTDGDFQVIVVGHEEPQFLKNISRNGKPVFYSFSSIRPPQVRGLANLEEKMPLLDLDKNMKITKGIQLLRSYFDGINYWYPLDSDDLMHKDFVSYVNGSKFEHGFVLNEGYFWFKAANRIIKADNLSLYCGSTLVLSEKNVPNLKGDINKDSIKVIPFCKYAHMAYHEYFEEALGQQPSFSNRPLLTYTLSSGDNISDGRRTRYVTQIKHRLKPFIKGKPVSNQFKSDFGIII